MFPVTHPDEPIACLPMKLPDRGKRMTLTYQVFECQCAQQTTLNIANCTRKPAVLLQLQRPLRQILQKYE